MYNVMIALFIEKGVLTEDEGTELVKELDAGVFPADFRLAHMRIKSILEEFKQKEEAKKKTDKKVLANLKTV